MPTSSISFIVTAQGKLRMQKALEELYPQLERGDEVIVVASKDEQPFASNRAALQAQLLTPGPGIWTTFAICGGPQWQRRQRAMERAKGQYLMFLDEFDFLAPDAVANMIRPRLKDKPLLFRVYHDQERRTIWKDRDINASNVIPMMLVAPNTGVVNWRSGTDSQCIAQAVETFGGVQWIRESIGVASRRPSVPRNLTSSVSSKGSHRVVEQHS